MRILIPLLAAILATSCASAEAPGASTLVGAWRLVSYVDTPAGGEPVYAFGREPSGQFVFTPDGYASVIIMRIPSDGMTTSSDPDPDACVPDWYCSYFGRYRIEGANESWVIHVEGGNIPSFIGSDQRRSFRVEGDRLTLSAEYMDADGRRVSAERVLVRRRAN